MVWLGLKVSARQLRALRGHAKRYAWREPAGRARDRRVLSVNIRVTDEMRRALEMVGLHEGRSKAEIARAMIVLGLREYGKKASE